MRRGRGWRGGGEGDVWGRFLKHRILEEGLIIKSYMIPRYANHAASLIDLINPDNIGHGCHFSLRFFR